MQDVLTNLAVERLGDPLEEQLWKNKAYMESRKLYHDQKEPKEEIKQQQGGYSIIIGHG